MTSPPVGSDAPPGVTPVALAAALASRGTWRLESLALSSLAIVPSLTGFLPDGDF